ncbi:MAG: xanthine dehydrogenase family protein molybdopterin-binding subunit, partial [Mesorhizobium sp.]
MTVHEIRTRQSESKRGDASDGAIFAEAVGGRLSRVDGPAKITGAAKYAVEQQLEGLSHAVLVESTIAAGKVRSIDTAAAESAPGVLLVLTPDNVLRLNTATDWLGTPPPDVPYCPLARDITFSGQHVAAVVAESFEQAVAAAALVKV